MIKKTFISSMIFLATSSAAMAKTTSYVGSSVSAGGFNRVSGVNGASVGVFAGKGTLVGKDEKFYMGGEVDASVTHNSTLTSYPNTSYGVGASFIPGVMLSKSTMLYGRAGLATSYYPKNSVQFATKLGAGVQTDITKNWGARVEYTSFGLNQSSQAGVGLVYKFD